jgi:hypothetical protein
MSYPVNVLVLEMGREQARADEAKEHITSLQREIKAEEGRISMYNARVAEIRDAIARMEGRHIGERPHGE